jgi:plasmid stabilization system protein ParE
MTYKVVIQPNARESLRNALHWLAERSPARAEAWFEGFVAAIESLANHPFRCGLALENGCIPEELRQLVYGKRAGRYRALYYVRDNVVRIVHIRHASRSPATLDDLGEWNSQ